MKQRVIIWLKKFLFGLHPDESVSVYIIHKKWRLRYGRLIYRKKISTGDIIAEMKRQGLRKGSVIFLRSSWDEFYNYTGTEEELLQAIIDTIGEEGTLMMPCMPIKRKKDKLFDVRKSVTAAGMLAEAFRRYKGVRRSRNPLSSVCAYGKYAEYLTCDHHLSETSWDERSPYYRFIELGGRAFAMGLGKWTMGTQIHCVESILRREMPYFASIFEDGPMRTLQYIDYDGSVKDYHFIGLNPEKPRKNIHRFRPYIRRYISSDYYMQGQVSNLQIVSFDARYTFDRVMALCRKGILPYRAPSKKGYEFEK